MPGFARFWSNFIFRTFGHLPCYGDIVAGVDYAFPGFFGKPSGASEGSVNEGGRIFSQFFLLAPGAALILLSSIVRSSSPALATLASGRRVCGI